MTGPVIGPDLEREIRRLMRQADIGWREASKIVIATYGQRPDRAEIRERR